MPTEEELCREIKQQKQFFLEQHNNDKDLQLNGSPCRIRIPSTADGGVFFANPSAVLPSLLPHYGVFPLFDSLDLADMKMFCIFAGVNKTEIKTYK